MNRLIKYVPDTDMRMGYDGLNKKSSLKTLDRGQFVAFVNRQRNKIKLATYNDMVAYYRCKMGERIDPSVIQYLPEFFEGGHIQYDKALEKSLRRAFPKYFEKESK